MFNSEYCEVDYSAKYNVVFVKWKKYCELEDYRAPLTYALEIIRNHKNCNYVADTRNGFENNPADTEWIANVFMPKAVEFGCKTIYFIIDKENALAEELKGQEEASDDIIEFKYIFDITEIPEKKKVIVAPYNSKWKDDFTLLKSRIETALGNLASAVEHVGSTSVEGLSAKPIIDIDIIIEDYSVFDTAVKLLNEIGYIYEGDLGIQEREVFSYEGDEALPKHHLYICPKNSAELKRHIVFRDYLRANPEAAEEYGRIKTEAARLYPRNMEAYIEYKGKNFIEEIYKKIL